ncbi:hypothetical protein ABH926_004357 [Catenulispora sp. GP43]|uniref:hypothetical protein n=1 Tax=Catenulispora sp. GP43 TaxID=3156263 RepID=UPI0035196022
MAKTDAEKAWRDYRDALARLDTAQRRLQQIEHSKLIDLLRQKLKGLDAEERSAFTFVRSNADMWPQLAIELFPELVRRVSGPHWRGVRDRWVLLHVGPHALKPLVAEHMSAVLADPEADSGEYWGLLDLLYYARFDDLMEQLIQAALASEDEDIRDAGMDWKMTLERSGI